MNFKIVSWNVENLFHQAASEEEKREYRAKLANLASAVRSMEPDVIALQEVGGPEALADLQAALDGGFPNAALSKRPDRRGIRVALLSKRKLHDPVDVVEFSPNVAFAIHDHRGNAVTTLRRGALWAKLKLKGLVVHVITAHLKSKLLDYPTVAARSAPTTRPCAHAPRALRSPNAPQRRSRCVL